MTAVLEEQRVRAGSAERLWGHDHVDLRRGVLTIAHGKARYLEMAKVLARSLALHDPDLPRAVVTDSNDPELRQLFHIGVKLQPALGQQVEQKIFLNVYSPFGRTMFIDSDCLTTRSLEPLWTKFEAVPFGVVGEQRYGGFHEYWLVNVGALLRKYDLAALPHFNGGFYYFDRSPAAERVFEQARQILRTYRDYGFVVFRGGAADEPTFALAMARQGLAPVEDDGSVMVVPEGLRGPLRVDTLRRVSRMRIDGKCVSPAIVHFAGGWNPEPVYARERFKLKLAHRGVASPEAISRAVGFAFTPPYIAYVIVMRTVKRIFLAGRRPNHPPSFW